jgi:hypothetical protein
MVGAIASAISAARRGRWSCSFATTAPMRRLALAKSFPFPYLIDATQQVARDYGAVCTPDFFGFNAALELQYHGRLYEVRSLKRVAGARRELFEAMAAIARDGAAPAEQAPSIGCSIKWRG